MDGWVCLWFLGVCVCLLRGCRVCFSKSLKSICFHKSTPQRTADEFVCVSETELGVCLRVVVCVCVCVAVCQGCGEEVPT